MVSAGTQKRQRKTAAAAVAEAEGFIDTAVAKAKRTSVAKKIAELGLTAEAITAERDGAGRSWRQVAINLGLGTPGAARQAYTELTGKPHYESGAQVKRAPRGSVNGAARKVTSPGWDDDTDQAAIEERLNGTWLPDTGEGKSFVPAHWSGTTITVARQVKGMMFEEEIAVARVTEFTFGKQGDQPLQVFVTDKYTGGTRCFFVSEITEVR